MTGVSRPILFLDVDGTLLPFGGVGMPTVPDAPESWTASSNPYLARIDRRLGPLLSGLGCDLVWATAWMGDANEVIAPLLGLPRLPVADLPEYSDDLGDDRLQWKTKALVRIADGRPFVWVDDVIGEADRWWVERRGCGRQNTPERHGARPAGNSLSHAGSERSRCQIGQLLLHHRTTVSRLGEPIASPRRIVS